MASPLAQRNGPGLSRPRRVAVLLAALLVVALGTGAVWWWSPVPPPPANATTIADAATTTEALATTGDVTPPELPARSEAATRTAVVGKAIDSGGGPLAGFRVALQRMDPKPVPIASSAMQLVKTTQQGRYPAVYTESDAAGGFAFESLEAGNYRCYFPYHEQHAQTFALGAGEVRELTLQVPLVALTLTFLRRGEAVKDCTVDCKAGNDRTTRLAKSGVMRFFAAPGRQELSVRVPPGAQRSPISPGPCLSRHVVLVPDGVPALQQCFEAGGTEIAFAVEDPDGNAIDNYTIDVEGTGAIDEQPGHYVLYGTRSERPTIAALPAGRWRATVTIADFRVEPRDFVTGLDDGRQVLSLAALPAASLLLTLRPSSPFFPAPAADRMPALVVDGRAVTCKVLRIERRGQAPPAFAYWGVPPGKATLCFQDRIDGDELVVLPFEPIAPVTIDLALGRNEVAVDVVPRAFVNLCGCDESGMEMSTAVLTVWVDGHRVRNRDATTPQRWLGWLPPGVHRVVIDRKGTSREHVLRVDRTNVSERYRP
jgi:hypothetical protein